MDGCGFEYDERSTTKSRVDKISRIIIFIISACIGLFYMWYGYTYIYDKTPYTEADIKPLYESQERLVASGGSIIDIKKEYAKGIKASISTEEDGYMITTKNSQVELTIAYNYQNEKIGADNIVDSYFLINLIFQITFPGFSLFFAFFFVLYGIFKFIYWIIRLFPKS